MLRGKLEFESGEEGREPAVLEHLLRARHRRHRAASSSAASTWRRWSRPSKGRAVTTGEQVTARDVLAGLPVLGESDCYDQVMDRLDARNDGERAAAIELALEALYLARKIDKEQVDGQTVYG